MTFRFTTRDLLWLTLAVSLAVGWWLNNNSLTTRLINAKQEFEIENHYRQSGYPHAVVTTKSK